MITVIKRAIQVSERLLFVVVVAVFLQTQVRASEAVHRSSLRSLPSSDIWIGLQRERG